MSTSQTDGRGSDGRFRPGVSGNPGGRPRDTLAALLRVELDKPAPDGRTNAEVVAEKLVEQAVAGNLKAIRELIDRLEGRPRQALDVTGDGGETTIRVEYVNNWRDGVAGSPDEGGSLSPRAAERRDRWQALRDGQEG